MASVCIAFGKKNSTGRYLVFDRNFFPDQRDRHLSEDDLRLIAQGLSNKDIDTNLLGWYGEHVRECEQCSNRVMSIPGIVLDEQSIHTSGSPHKYDRISLSPQQEFMD